MIKRFLIFAGFLCLLTLSVSAVPGQQPGRQVRSQEVSEIDGVPVLLKHLPDWENVRSAALFAQSVDDLRRFLGDRSVLSLVELTAGTEAVAAPYPEGKLLIVEYTNAASSLDADAKFAQHLAQNPETLPVVYRRVGNYSVFVFDAADQAAAGALIDRVKYEKTIQWLGEDPFALRRLERYFVTTTRDIFVSTVVFIIAGIGLAILAGIAVGIAFFRVRESRRATRSAYSDAGGLTRLNLDDLSEELPLG